MTRKRFHSDYYDADYYTDIVDEEKELDYSLTNPSQRLTIAETVDLLNELHEENQRLTQAVADLLVREFSLKNFVGSDQQRITELTNHFLTQFIKSKGHTLEEIEEFLSEQPDTLIIKEE